MSARTLKVEKGLRPIYEWTWTRPGGAMYMATRSARRAGAYKRFAVRLGGSVERRRLDDADFRQYMAHSR